MIDVDANDYHYRKIGQVNRRQEGCVILMRPVELHGVNRVTTTRRIMTRNHGGFPLLSTWLRLWCAWTIHFNLGPATVCGNACCRRSYVPYVATVHTRSFRYLRCLASGTSCDNVHSIHLIISAPQYQLASNYNRRRKHLPWKNEAAHDDPVVQP